MDARIPHSLGLILRQESAWKRDLFLVVLGSILITLCAPISIRLPFTPVAIALAPQLCLALGLVLGSKRGAFAVLLYLFQGAVGLPVFALGASGLGHLMGPCGGYLLGYAAAAYVTGYLLEQIRNRTAVSIWFSLIAGNLIIYLFGVVQLSLFVGLKSALFMGMLPFLFGDALKLLVVYKGFKRFL